MNENALRPWRSGVALTNAADDYLKALVDADAEQIGEKPPFDEEDIDIRAEFRQAWRDVMTGNTLTLDEMWKALDEE